MIDLYHDLRPFKSWFESDGNVIWWLMPIKEPPYVGTSACSDWPFEEKDEPNLFWTRLPDCNVLMQQWKEKYANSKI